MSSFEVDGHTGHRVIVDCDGDPYLAGACLKVYVDEIRRKVIRVVRLRDGGTTILYLDNDDRIVFPRGLSDTNRTPTYNGEEIHE